jgi:adenylate cyclase
MRLYAAHSDRAQALRQYQICRDSLRRELDVNPEPETERLFREIQASAQAGARLKGLRLVHRLTAILAAEVVGYSRLVEQDEAGTLVALRSRRKNVLEPLLSLYHGRVVKTTCDGVLVEFRSAVNAVECAVGLQKALIAANADLPEDHQILLRVGVNLGNVIIENGDLYGDSVNIAARLEAMAEPGDIYVSSAVFDYVRNKVNLRFEDLGEQALKKIREPIKVYRIASVDGAGSITHELPLPLKPSIAVLPFTNMSNDPEQQYFSDGITEDIITELSRFRQLFVIARNSSFAYKGLSKDLKQVGRDLGVRYLLEGSVRKSAERVRITAELIDATTGSRIWGERYDRNLQDVFALQDEITETIVAAIEPELSSAERERSRRRPPESLDAWACYHQGMWHLYQTSAKDATAAERMFRRALEIEPQFTQALSAAAYLNFQRVFCNFPDARDETLQRALADARAAVALDDRDAFAHQTLGRILSLQDEHDEAIAEQRLAIDLNPSFALAHHGLATALVRAGRYSEALNECDKAIRLSPFDPYRWAFFATRARALLHLEDYDSAVKWCRKAARLTTLFWPYAHLTCALGHLGRKVEAKAALDDLLRMKPDFSPALLWSTISIRDNRAAYDHYVEGLRKAGLPES